MLWPSESPGIDAIELLWEEMDRKGRKRKPTSPPMLIEMIKDALESVINETLLKYVNRILWVIKAAIGAEGVF